MARKESVTIDMILDTSFAMMREEGFQNITARKVAAKVGCSTQPIFRVYKNMEELWDAVYDKAVQYFQDYLSLFPRTGKRPFSNLGVAYISFAKEEKKLFELLFLSGGMGKRSMYEILNGDNGNVVYEINLARVQGCEEPEDIFNKMWIFIHGAACLTLTNNYDLSNVQTLELLEQTYDGFTKM
ncbi:MAG: TetR/AcrR family transcriptional regulator [Lachnospiraceae bacterium]|nr:TetR/AcrR family transcriptional regulator [Lachnospiraceae bacterium]